MCQVPTFSTGKRRATCSRRWPRHYGNTDDSIVVGDRAVFANSQYVSADFFAVFGLTASAGRLLTEQDLPGERRGPGGRRRGVLLGRGTLRQRRGRDREDDHRLRHRGGDRRSGGAGISLSRCHGYLGALAHIRIEPRPAQLPRRREARARRRPHACAGADADHWRQSRAAVCRESSEDRDPDALAGTAHRQSPGNVVGADERRGRRLAHWLRQYREPPACAGGRQDARNRASRRARRRPGPCGTATTHRELCARGHRRAGGSPARVHARARTRGVVTHDPAPHRRSAGGHAGPPVRARALAAVDADLRARAGPACVAT